MKLMKFFNFMIFFHFQKYIFSYVKTDLKQINDKRTIVNLNKDIVLLTRLHFFCTSLFTINIKVVIQMHSFLFDLIYTYILHI